MTDMPSLPVVPPHVTLSCPFCLHHEWVPYREPAFEAKALEVCREGIRVHQVKVHPKDVAP